MTRKPDRWERIIEDLEFIRDCEGKPTPVCESADVLKLLRREHQAMVRMVRKEHLGTVGRSERCEGWNQAIECILELLKKRAS